MSIWASIKSVFAGPNGKTALVAAHATAGIVVFLGLAVWHVIGEHRPFDAAGFAGAWVMILGASAAAIGGHAWLQAKASKDAGSDQ